MGWMPTTFRPYQPNQMLLLAPDLQEWLPSGHLAHHVSDLVDSLELGAFYARYEGDGRRNLPYEPSRMVKVLIYAYATGVFSSRAIARKLQEDVAFRVLGAGNFRQHRTICEFRRRHLDDFEGMFVEVVRVARKMGVVRFGTLSVDGTKVRANASKRKAMSYGRMLQHEARLKEEIQGLLARAGAVDEEEDARYGEQARGDELPAELERREQRLAASQEAKERLEAAQREADDARGREPGQGRNPKGGRPYKRDYGEPDPKAQSNFTDPESQIMKTSTEGFQQCYNAQTVVDEAHQLIVATDVETPANDQGQMLPLLDEVSGPSGLNPRWCSPTRATATRRTWWRSRSAASMLISRWAARARRRWRWTPIPVRPPTVWARSSLAPRARVNTPSASGCPRRPTAGPSGVCGTFVAWAGSKGNEPLLDNHDLCHVGQHKMVQCRIRWARQRRT